MKKIDPKELTDNAIKLIGQDWMLISAGTEEKFNTMTASWGTMGFLWNKPVAFVFIRPERYTFGFSEKCEYFTLSFFGKEHRKALNICGSKSGRDTDKVKEAGLTPYFTELGTPAFKEARIVIEGRKMYGDMLKADAFPDKEEMKKWYGDNNGFHKMYVLEIVNMWVE